MGDVKDDIEKYLRGELSPAEMHALEKKALSDPFLADALEGGSTISAEDFSSDLGSLKSKIRQPAKEVHLRVWITRIAAGLALIAAVIYFIRIQQTVSDDRIAQTETQKQALPEPKKDTVTTAPVEKQTAESVRRSVPDHTSSKSPSGQLAQVEVQPAEEEVVLEDAQGPAETGSGVVQGIAAEKPYSGTVTENDDVEPLDKMAGFIAAAPMRTVTGTVIDREDGRPLPGVNVTIQGTSIGTITDEEGKYKLSADSLEAGLLFSYIGYEEQKVAASSTGALDVALNPDVAQLSEVVVVGYGGTKREDTDFNPIIELAEPAGGRKAYRQYLEQNLKYPEQALNNKVEGRVTVQFTVESSGQMSNFKILRGLGYGCEEEVLRLIREGPKWKPSRRNTEAVSDKVKVRLKFTLPKK
jgi:TonB family protein